MTSPATFSFDRDLSMTNETVRATNAPPHAAPRTTAASLLPITMTTRPIAMKRPP